MPAYLVLPLLIGALYVLVNVGSKEKVPFVKIALPLAVVSVIVYVTSLLLVPLVNHWMQFWTHIRLP